MDRRNYLRGIAGVGALATAGCLGSTLSLRDGNPNVTLPEPEREYTSEELPYPAWGQRVPDVTLPAPIASQTVTIRAIETPSIVTFFYSHCQTVCPILIQTIRNIQTDAIESDYIDQVTFLPTTFDPQRDDAARLREYSEMMNIAVDDASWQFLRPTSPERAKATVEKEFGVTFERTHPDDMDMYMFAHSALTYLINTDGYVERAYRTQTPDINQMIRDLETLRKR
ncbi:MAG: SCO1/SenC/PrrC family protein [Haloquadratum walsbyi J07HQW1]|jgi:Uncharacterized protein SCO1/SenC/PrrC, involved in biogenesis of respiratory and photosynthetic systems|uniref:SCO1/SenC/PrrC family protein n=1 Tax=Haloquadratum walsbyi J07HQW1 TaxID=1238424 RepID=U1N5Y9_9EURY|nr:MAG: SCO1/SenC/PrrC family protein [Haloquadratum walsbyi J07HQW1]